jgi:hypothetical protein
VRWHLLVHQLPPRPPYLRAKIAQRLARVGALPLKNSVYLLPVRADSLEDFQWITTEARAGGGSAYVFEARFTEGREEQAVTQRFLAARQADYKALAAQLRRLEREVKSRGPLDSHDGFSLRLARLRRRLEEVGRVDFFGSAERKEVETLMRRVEKNLSRSGGAKTRKAPPPDLIGRTWVTRRGIKVDRMASAWLVRRFVDPRAQFRFVDPRTPKGSPDELRFDMVDGDFTHEGNRCTFEVLVTRAGIRDRAVSWIGQIVHDIDLKDAKYGRPETSGVARLIDGAIAKHTDDADRLRRALALFDDLYASFGGRSQAE